ncbi:MAG: YceI family protein [Bacteroidota bacterium]
MKKYAYMMAAVLIMIGSAFTFIQAQEWKIAEGYSVKFDAGDPSGEFTGLKGSIKFDEKNLAASSFNVTVDVATINTGNGMKNTHAKGAGWFDVEKYPTITFTSSQIKKAATGYEAVGTLDMHGVKKEITIPFTFASNTFDSSFEVNRKDFNLDDGKHEKMSPTIKVTLHVPVTK